MRVFFKLISLIFIILERLKGHKTVIVVHPPTTGNEYFEVKFFDLELRIFCRKKQYRRKYDKWYVLGDKRSVYQAYSMVVGEYKHPNGINLDDLRMACALDVDIPALLPEFVEFKYHRVVIIHAYIDIITERFARIKHGFPP